MHLAVEHGKVNALLISNVMNNTDKDCHWQADIVKCLIAGGAHVNVLNNSGLTPLMVGILGAGTSEAAPQIIKYAYLKLIFAKTFLLMQFIF